MTGVRWAFLAVLAALGMATAAAFQITGQVVRVSPTDLTIVGHVNPGEGSVRIFAVDETTLSFVASAVATVVNAAGQSMGALTTGGGGALFGLAPGRYVVEVRASAYTKERAEFSVAAGSSQTLTVPLARAAGGGSSSIGQPPMPPPPPPVVEMPVFLNVKFELSPGQTAVVRDYKDMRVTLHSLTPDCPPGTVCTAMLPRARLQVLAPGTPIRFIHPKSSDRWRAGDRREIYWRYPSSIQGQLVNEELELLRSGQLVGVMLTRQKFAEPKGRFNWTIPQDLPSGDYAVRLTVGADQTYQATSSAFQVASTVQCPVNCAVDTYCDPRCGREGCPRDFDCQCSQDAECPTGSVCAGGRCQETNRCNNCNSNGICNYGCQANGCGQDPDCAGLICPFECGQNGQCERRCESSSSCSADPDCLPRTECTDTDGGLNVQVMGEARDTRGGYFRDACQSDALVREAYCTGTATASKVDVVLATDLSGSMDDTFPGQIPGCPTGNKREIAKCVEKQFVDAVLAANPLNRVGLVAFQGAVTSTYAPSRDAPAIKNVISGYATCISCGIRGAESLLDAHSTDPGAAKVIVIMSDGRANVCYGSGPCSSPAREMVEFACAAKAKGYRIWAVGYGLDQVSAANFQEAACCDDCSHFANGADAAALSRIYSDYARQIASLGSVTAAAAGASSVGSVVATQTLSCPQGSVCLQGACAVRVTCSAQCVADPARSCDSRCGQGVCPPDPDCTQACPYACRGDNFCDARCGANTYCTRDPDCASQICPLNCAADQRCVAACATTADCQADPDCGCRSDAECPPASSRWCEGARACIGISQGECTQPGTPSARCVVSPYSTTNCTTCPGGCAGGVCRSATAPCTDTDGGINYTVPGTVLFNGSEYRDRCLSDLYIEENYCHNNARWSLTQPCDGRCLDGACRTNQPAGCPIDTDGGLNYSVAGQINYQGTIWADTCKSGRVLSEATCTRVMAAWLYDIRVVDYTCPNGCANGACMATPPQCLDADSDGYNQPVAGMHALCMDKIDCNDNNAAIHPGAQEVCRNNVDENCNGQIDEGCPSGCGGLAVGQCRGTFYCDPTQTLVNNCYVCPCPAGQSCVNNQCVAQGGCADSDGGRAYFVRGSVSIPGAASAIFDSCPYENSSSGTGSPLYAKPPPQTQAINPLLKERYCDGGQFRTEEWRCPIDCRNGACQGMPPDVRCSDGTLSGQCSATKPKRCDGGTLVNACAACGCPSSQTCMANDGTCVTPSTCSPACAPGQTCVNGVCTGGGYTCADSDGGRVASVRGTTTRRDGGIWTDSCININQVQEGYCDLTSPSGVSTTVITCPIGRQCLEGACQGGSCPAQCVADASRTCDSRCGQGDCPVDPDCGQACPYSCGLDRTCDARCQYNAYCGGDPDCAPCTTTLQCQQRYGTQNWACDAATHRCTASSSIPNCPMNCGAGDGCFAACAATLGCPADPDCPVRCTTAVDCTRALGADWNCNLAGQCVRSALVGNCPLGCAGDGYCNSACATTTGCGTDPDCGTGSSPYFSKAPPTGSPVFSKAIVFVASGSMSVTPSVYATAAAGEIDDEVTDIAGLLPPESGGDPQVVELSVGERRSMYGATVAFLDVQSRRGVFVVMAGSEQGTPVCDRIGTKQEGWYLGDRLLRKEVCACRAICKEIGKKNEGYYSSCSGKLIYKTKCSQQVQATVGAKSLSIEQNPQLQLLELRSLETAVTSETLRVEEGRISMQTPRGPKEILVLPEDAKAVAADQGFTEVRTPILDNLGGRPVYRVRGKVARRLFGLIPYTDDGELIIDAQTGEVV